MCGRYALAGLDDHLPWPSALAQRAGQPAAKTEGEVFPGDLVPVLANSRSMKPTLFAMRWGYTLPGGRRVINARSETAASSPLFADGMRQRRCLVPAVRYDEWERRGREKIRYAVRPSGCARFFMAAVYRMEQDGPVFAILTRSSAERIAFIHDRMPVILPDALAADWLSPASDPEQLLHAAVSEVEFGAMLPARTVNRHDAGCITDEVIEVPPLCDRGRSFA